MGGDIHIGLGELAPYVEMRIRELLDRDPSTNATLQKLLNHSRLAAKQASWVQCVGMREPIPIDAIYQPSHLVDGRGSSAELLTLIKRGQNSIIVAEPGRGKTTLLRWIYTQLQRDKSVLPLLFTLRHEGATEDLTFFIRELRGGVAKRLAKARIALLIDGYDEISESRRRKVSKALREFGALNLGTFCLTCRTYFTIFDLTAPYYEIGPFTRSDSISYINTFSRFFGSDIDADELLNDLQEHQLDSFSSHPLLLTLVCILKTGPMLELPRHTIGLIKRAIDVLSIRWDYEKSVTRKTALTLDGEERIECLKRIAWKMKRYVEPESLVYSAAREHLRLVQQPDVNIGRLLLEIAQFFGILVPVGQDSWTFSHKSMHDYLAARFVVDSGSFSVAKLDNNARSAYAACMVPDATAHVVHALRNFNDIYVVSECLYNSAKIDPLVVAPEFVQHFKTVVSARFWPQRRTLHVALQEDCFHWASDELLCEIAKYAGHIENKGSIVLFCYTFAELLKRGVPIPVISARNFKTAFQSYTVERRRGGSFTFSNRDIEQAKSPTKGPRKKR